MSDYLQRFLPGILLCTVITITATLLEAAEVHFTEHTYLEALVVAILLGAAVRTIWKPGPRWIPGIAFSAKFVLECAIVMLGASISAATITALGPILIVGIVCIVAIAIGTSYLIARLLGLSQRLAILIACGNSICGNSAIAAEQPGWNGHQARARFDARPGGARIFPARGRHAAGAEPIQSARAAVF